MNYPIKTYLKTVLLTIAFLLVNTMAKAQDNSQNQNNHFWKNVRFGGGIGLSTGTGFFSATLAPSAIYEFNNQFALGFGLSGTYNKRKNFFKSTIFGGSIIGLYNPINIIQLSAEFEELNVNRKWNDNAIKNQNYWYSALFLGAGYRNRNITFGIRYDVLYDESKSLYAEPWIPFVRFYF